MRRAIGPTIVGPALDGWFGRARHAQYPLWRYAEDAPDPPDNWLVIGGRGAGKTRLGAEWVNALVRGFSPFADRRHSAIALVGETLADVREVRRCT